MKPHRVLDMLAHRRACSPADEIAATLRHHADRRYRTLPPRDDRGPLADVLVHSGDIRIPLGLPFEPDRQQAAEAMDRLTQRTPNGLVPLIGREGVRRAPQTLIGHGGRARNLRTSGGADGMAVGGRTALLNQLDGPGLSVLLQRISG